MVGIAVAGAVTQSHRQKLHLAVFVRHLVLQIDLVAGDCFVVLVMRLCLTELTCSGALNVLVLFVLRMVDTTVIEVSAVRGVLHSGQGGHVNLAAFYHNMRNPS